MVVFLLCLMSSAFLVSKGNTKITMGLLDGLNHEAEIIKSINTHHIFMSVNGVALEDIKFGCRICVEYEFKGTIEYPMDYA